MSQFGYDGAVESIRDGKAVANSAWMLLKSESDRKGFALKPFPWEGPGEYQSVTFTESKTTVLVRLPVSGKHLPRPEKEKIPIVPAQRPVIKMVTNRLSDGSETYDVVFGQVVLNCVTATDCFDLSRDMAELITRHTGTRPIIVEE